MTVIDTVREGLYSRDSDRVMSLRSGVSVCRGLRRGGGGEGRWRRWIEEGKENMNSDPIRERGQDRRLWSSRV